MVERRPCSRSYAFRNCPNLPLRLFPYREKNRLPVTGEPSVRIPIPPAESQTDYGQPGTSPRRHPIERGYAVSSWAAALARSSPRRSGPRMNADRQVTCGPMQRHAHRRRARRVMQRCHRQVFRNTLDEDVDIAVLIEIAKLRRRARDAGGVVGDWPPRKAAGNPEREEPVGKITSHCGT